MTPGIKPARRQASALRGRGIAGLFVSPLGQAVATTRVISDALDLDVEVIGE